MAIKWPWSRNAHVEQLADLLANPANRETFLGVKETVMPTQEQIKADAAKMISFARSGPYKVFAEEAWSRVLTHLDVMMDEKASKDRVDFHRGACQEALDLLRLSYQAYALMKADSERGQSVSTGR